MKLDFVCFRVRNLSGNHTVGPVTNSVSRKGTDLLSASFTVSSSVQLISVWVHAQNLLGSAVSFPINYTLSDIGKTAAVGVWWVCEVHGNFCSESVLCFMCNDTTQLFVSHEITMMLWMELETSFAVKGVLLLCSKLEVYDKWWLSLMANNDVMESYLFKRCKFFFWGGIFIHLNSDAIDSWSWPTRLLFPRVHHPSEAVCEDSKPGDPIQSRSTDVDLISRLSKTSQQFRLLQEI